MVCSLWSGLTVSEHNKAILSMIIAEPVATITPALQRLVWLVMIYYEISDLPFFGKFLLQLQFDYGNAAALHSSSVPAGIITINMVTVTIITTLL